MNKKINLAILGPLAWCCLYSLLPGCYWSQGPQAPIPAQSWKSVKIHSNEDYTYHRNLDNYSLDRNNVQASEPREPSESSSYVKEKRSPISHQDLDKLWIQEQISNNHSNEADNGGNAGAAKSVYEAPKTQGPVETQSKENYEASQKAMDTLPKSASGTGQGSGASSSAPPY